MQADTPTPTDAEIDAEWLVATKAMRGYTRDLVRHFVRAVLAKWGAPAPASVEVAARVDVDGFIVTVGAFDCAPGTLLYTAPPAHSYLHTAAQALIDRWDTPKWKDAEHTGAFIQRLREALAAPPAQEARVPLTEKQISKLWSDAHNDTSDRMAHQVLVRLVEAEHGITAAQKPRVPLSDEQIFKAYTTATGKKLPKLVHERPRLLQIFRLAEAIHGITAAQKETPNVP